MSDNIPPQIESLSRPPAIASLSTKRWLPVTIGIAAGTTAILFFFDPAQHAFYPVCLLHKYTGLSCPGCGALRATHRLLHGEFSAAFRLNPLWIISMPFVAWFGFREIIRKPGAKTLPSGLSWSKLGWILVAVAVAFTVIRNLPAFSWMQAP